MLDRSAQNGTGIAKPYVRAANVHWNRIELDSVGVNEMEFSPEQLGRYRLEPSDLLVTEGGVTVGRSAIWKGELEECYYQNSLNRARALSNGPLAVGFLYYWMYFTTANGYVDLAAEKATFGHLTNEKLKAFPIVVPEQIEQQAIVTFLDRETARIDALIAKQRQLVERLQEQRTALISQIVTKGLDPDAPMKESGIEWLGKMPAHWGVRPLWSVGQLQRGFDLTTEEHELGEVPVYSSSGLSGYHDKALVKGPGVVTGRYGTIGKVYYVPEDYWPMNTTLYIKNFWGNDPQFVFYLLQLLPFDAFSDKSAVPGIDRNDLHRLRVPHPPLREQAEIVCFLRATERQFSQVTEKAELMTVRLTEYRAALISAAVTGKIDVRGAVA